MKSFLWTVIGEMSEHPGRFAKNPDTDFSRNRKLGFEDLMRFLVSMGSGTTAHELLKYFDFDPNTISNSAFLQQRAKLLPDTLPYLMRRFNERFPLKTYRGKYYLLGIDGSELNIARNPDDPSTFYPSNRQSFRGFNMLHTISLFDILSKRYLDCVIQPGRKKNEFQAICDIADRYSCGGSPIFIADRGFSSYNFYAHAAENGVFYMIRAKDINTKRLLNRETLPDRIDSAAEIILTRSQSKKKRKRPDLAEQYRYICVDVPCDYLQPESEDEYLLSLRVVRFEVAEGCYVNIFTNLPADEFPVDEIKRIYHLRWDIETSFRDLKHTLGVTQFHSKIVEYIEQEIWTRLILFNFCSIITMHVVIAQKDTKHVYQVNFSMAMKICHHFVKLCENKSPPDVEGLIGSFTLPIRLGRNYARQHRFQLPASFCYRFS